MNRFLPLAASVLLLCCAENAIAQTYTNLIPNRSLHLWNQQNGKPVEKGWSFDADGSLHLTDKGGNILTRDEYQDFDLWFDFRISEKGNNGIKYRVQKYDSAWLGPEYQIQDDAAFPKLPAKHYTASLYDLIDRSSPVFERRYLPLNEWSSGRIIVQNNRLRHWMNGNLIIDEDTDSQRFSEAVQASKFKDTAGFGKNVSGRIMLTDHGSEVRFRNLYIRNLNNCPMVR
jgi:hypothetical protein